jgi:hypothetical protein
MHQCPRRDPRSPDLMMNRREWIARAAAGLAAALLPGVMHAQGGPQGATLPELTVYKDPGCGCCDAWVRHVQANGFRTKLFDTQRLDDVKRSLGVPRDLASCHTTLAGRYLVEGHVPADVIRKLVREQPRIAGIAVPGMPIGSPGMEVPGTPAQRYDIVAFDVAGKRSVFARR